MVLRAASAARRDARPTPNNRRTPCPDEYGFSSPHSCWQSPRLPAPPHEIAVFNSLTPDQQADVIEHLQSEQAEFDRLLAKWGPIHACETGRTYNWAINTGNGYYGGLQFSQDTWQRAGGLAYAPRADLARPIDQMRVADAWLARTSWAQWPHCSRVAGYR